MKILLIHNYYQQRGGEDTCVDSLYKLLKDKGVQGAMIGKAAVSNPQIFNMLKGKKSVSIEQIKKDYLDLIKKFNPPFRYQKNIMKRLI